MDLFAVFSVCTQPKKPCISSMVCMVGNATSIQIFEKWSKCGANSPMCFQCIIVTSQYIKCQSIPEKLSFTNVVCVPFVSPTYFEAFPHTVSKSAGISLL